MLARLLLHMGSWTLPSSFSVWWQKYKLNHIVYKHGSQHFASHLLNCRLHLRLHQRIIIEPVYWLRPSEWQGRNTAWISAGVEEQVVAMVALFDGDVHLHGYDCDRLGQCWYCHQRVQPNYWSLDQQTRHGHHYICHVHMVPLGTKTLPQQKLLFLMILF